jgi:hypothetical protein
MSIASWPGRTGRARPCSQTGTCSSMEGTSGAADLGSLRGGSGDAALGGIAEDRPSTGRPGPAGVSSRRGSDSMTRGVRADRVGIKLSSGRPQGRRLGREAALGRGRSWPVKTRLAGIPAGRAGGIQAGARAYSGNGRRGSGGASSPGLGAGAVIITRGFGRACRWRLRASRQRGRRAERASARSGCTRRGSGGRAGVLAGCGGCRSRRAALGPGRKAGGLAPWLPLRERRGRMGAGSRVAVAKATSTRAATPVAGSS